MPYHYIINLLMKLIIEKIIKEYTKFNFYEVDYEEEYKEYLATRLE